MAFRLGILISIFFIGLVMLYLRNKERWEWDKIVILFTATIVSISIFGGIGIFLYSKLSEKPEIQKSFWDINLSNSKSTIKFIKGPPVKITDGGFWIYTSNIHGVTEIYFVRFREDLLWLVGYMGGGLSGGPGIHGFKQGSRLDDVIKFFGKPSHLFESKDNPQKLYLFNKYNVFFVSKDGKVSIYGVYNSEYGTSQIGEMIEKATIDMKFDST